MLFVDAFEIVAGETDWPSITSRAGEEIVETSTGPEPVGQPFTTGGAGVPFGATTSVWFDSLRDVPSAFFAVTRTRTVWPTSAPRSW